MKLWTNSWWEVDFIYIYRFLTRAAHPLVWIRKRFLENVLDRGLYTKQYLVKILHHYAPSVLLYGVEKPSNEAYRNLSQHQAFLQWLSIRISRKSHPSPPPFLSSFYSSLHSCWVNCCKGEKEIIIEQSLRGKDPCKLCKCRGCQVKLKFIFWFLYYEINIRVDYE